MRVQGQATQTFSATLRGPAQAPLFFSGVAGGAVLVILSFSGCGYPVPELCPLRLDVCFSV